MIRPDQRLALFMEGAFADNTGKMGLGVLRYSANPIVAMIDSQSLGRRSRELIGMDKDVPVVASISEALKFKPDALVLGIAPPGGLIPASWYPALDQAVQAGISLVNGLHDKLVSRYPNLAPGQWIWDVREEPQGLTTGTGAARLLSNRRILTIGTDMAIGKMTASLELHAGLRKRGARASFVATGQTGMVIAGSGVPLDAVRLDFAPGAIEQQVLFHRDQDFVIVEGQGSLLNPASSATLPLIRGTCPTDFLLCHRAGMEALPRHSWVKVPPLTEVVRMYQDLATLGGNLPEPNLLGVCLNTSGLGEQEALRTLEQTEAEAGAPVVDPVRFGVERLVDRLLA